jgi:Gas vesicle synthesis protein GvpL/GvpF
MSARGRSTSATEPKQRTGVCIYGIVPADVEVDPDARGLGDPPAPVTLVRHGEIAALVSEIDVSRPLGRPEELLAYEHLLDAAVTEAPVIPVRFGTVMTDRDAVVRELLAPYHDELLTALKELEGRAEYIVKGRYVEETVLREILSENPEIARLHDEIRGKPEELTRNERVAVGQLIYQAIEAKREADTRKVADALAPHSVAVVVREPTHELDAAHVAVLAEIVREPELEDALQKFVREWEGRVKLRLLGPLAPYDFVTSLKPNE